MKNIKHKLILLILIIPCQSGMINAEQNTGITFNGYMYTDLGLLQTVHSSSKDEADFAGAGVLSVNPKNANQKYGKVEGLFDVILPYGSTIHTYTANTADSSDSIEQALDFLEFFSFGKTPVLLDVRKLYLSFFVPFADISMGRQIINFGNGFVFSPIDVFSSVALQDLDLRRQGSDIGMLRVPFSDVAGFDVITEMPFLDDPWSVAVKLFTTLAGWDFTCIGIFRDHKKNADLENETVAGLTFKGDAVVGVYGEAVLHYLTGPGDLFFEGMLGTDYSIIDNGTSWLNISTSSMPGSRVSGVNITPLDWSAILLMI